MKRYAHLRISSDPAADADYYYGQLDEMNNRVPECCRCGRKLDGDEYFRDDEGYKCDRCVHREYYESRDEYLDSLAEDYGD